MRIEHVGSARIARSTGQLGSTGADLVVVGDDLTNWPTGSIGPFYIAMGKGTLTEEKILCSSRTGNSIQVWTDGASNGRGQDGTVAQVHPINTTMEHIWTAVEADAANAHIESTGDVHTRYVSKATATAKGDLLAATGAGVLVALPVGDDGDSLIADSAAASGVSWGAATATLSPFLLMGA